jgi:nucleoid DNA-binding protein
MSKKKQEPVQLSDLVNKIHALMGVDKAAISHTLRGLKEVVKQEITAGGQVDMGRDFGRFTAIVAKGRNHIVPTTDKVVRSKDRLKIRFQPSAAELKDIPMPKGRKPKGGLNRAFSGR